MVPNLMCALGARGMCKAALFLIFAALGLPLAAQVPQSVIAMSDFYALYGRMQQDGKKLAAPGDMKGYIGADIKAKLEGNIAYRAAFIGQVSARCGFAAGDITLTNVDATISALTGFLMLVEDNGDITTWTPRELTRKYDRLLQTAWADTNPPLFTLTLQTYCAYRRGELGW